MTLGSHQKTIGDSQNWITPRFILDALGPFDLDPAAADPRPWDFASESWAWGSLELPWFGRVFLNPPFDRREVGDWVARLARHGNGILLIHARTETGWFQPIWDHASAILFLADRLHFHHPDGTRCKANSGAPALLAAFGETNVEVLKRCGLKGVLTEHWTPVGGTRPAVGEAA
jgi:hypothetical protein